MEMVNLICGRAGSGKTSRVFEMIRSELADRKRIILIVPEQETVLYETLAAATLPPSSSLYLDVINFKRLANLVSRSYGGCGRTYISKTASRLYMHLAQIATKDMTAVIKGDDESIDMLMSAVSEMKMSGFTPEDLETAAELLVSDADDSVELEARRALSKKLKDLSLIMATFASLESEAGKDSDDILPELKESLRKHDYFSGASVYLDSFFSLTPIEYDIAASIIRQAENATFTFTYPGSESDEMQFSFTERYYKTVLSLASRYSKDNITKTVLPEPLRAKKPAIAVLDRVWDQEFPPYTDNSDGVTLTVCRDKYQEAFAVTAKVKSLLDSGVRARDIAIITRDSSSILGVIDSALDEADIPYFLASRVDISSYPEIKLIFAALAVISGGWRPSDVISAVKTGAFPINQREADIFERYVTTWQIRGKSRYTASIWSMNPDGFSQVLTESGSEILSMVNRAKDAIVSPLSRFADIFDRSPTVKAVCRAIWELMSELGVYEKCIANSAADAHELEIKRQLPETINTILDTLVSVLGDIKCDSRKFARFFKLAISEVNIGAIPAGIDRVTVGQANALRVGNISHAILLDVNEGIFPAAVSDDGFFSDHDKLLLEGAELPLRSGELERLEGELLWFYRSVTSAAEGIHIFATENGGALSSGATRVLELLPSLKPRYFDELSPEDMIFDKSTLLNAAASLAGESGEAARAILEKANFGQQGVILGNDTAAQNARLSPENAKMIFPNAKLYLSQSRLDSFVMCKFGYYCNYILKLKEERRAEIRAVDVGNFIHSILESYFSRQSGSEDMSENEKNAAIDAIVAEYITSNLGDAPPARSINLFKRLRRSVGEMIRSLSREFSVSEFKPVGFELKLKDRDSASPPMLHIPLKDGGEAVIGGVIDRLDVYRNDGKAYVRIVDYKTGTKKFSLDDIRSGLNMQLLIYLFSVCGSPSGDFRKSIAGDDEIVPAGAIYFAASPAELRQNGDVTPEAAAELAAASFTRSGIVTDDIEILKKMDPELSGKYIPIKLKKDGSFAAGSLVASAAAFAELNKELIEIVGKISDEMRSGAANAKPIKNRAHDPCEWCGMRVICRQKKQAR